MDKDYYSILGVTPASEDVVIRAAYRALMRRYHPDADASAEAAERAREINEAYSVLSDPEKRARYEGSAPRSVISLEPHSEVLEQPRRSLLAPVAAFGFAALAAGMVAFALSPPDGRLRILGLASGEEARPAPKQQELVQAKASGDEAVPCTHPSVQTLVKQELFRRATSLQSGDGETLRTTASGTRIRINSPLSAEGKSGTFGCRGWLAIDLPAGLVVDEGRTNLTAEIAYELAKGSDGRMSLASLSGVNALVRSLGTAAPPPREPESAETPAPIQIAEKEARKSVQKPANPVVASATARPVARALRSQPPAAKCSSEPNDASRLICSNDNLASLDRQLAAFYRQSWDKADETRRAALLGSRQRFNERRNACGSQNCMTSAYVARLREISDIMAGRKQR